MPTPIVATQISTKEDTLLQSPSGIALLPKSNLVTAEKNPSIKTESFHNIRCFNLCSKHSITQKNMFFKKKFFRSS